MQSQLEKNAGNGNNNIPQQSDAIAIGKEAGFENQGQYSIAIGSQAGSLNQPNNTIHLNATGAASASTFPNTDAFYVEPVRAENVTTNDYQFLYYNNTNKEIVRHNDIKITIDQLI